jgi:hypothetical protein
MRTPLIPAEFVKNEALTLILNNYTDVVVKVGNKNGTDGDTPSVMREHGMSLATKGTKIDAIILHANCGLAGLLANAIKLSAALAGRVITIDDIASAIASVRVQAAKATTTNAAKGMADSSVLLNRCHNVLRKAVHVVRDQVAGMWILDGCDRLCYINPDQQFQTESRQSQDDINNNAYLFRCSLPVSFDAATATVTTLQEARQFPPCVHECCVDMCVPRMEQPAEGAFGVHTVVEQPADASHIVEDDLDFEDEWQ